MKAELFRKPTAVAALEDIEVRQDQTGTWMGNFRAPAVFDFDTALPGGIGLLRLADGRWADIYLLQFDPSTGRGTFHLPGGLHKRR